MRVPFNSFGTLSVTNLYLKYHKNLNEEKIDLDDAIRLTNTLDKLDIVCCSSRNTLDI